VQVQGKGSLLPRLREAAINFVSDPASARPLAWLRIGLATVLLLQAVAIAKSLLDLYANLGVIQWSLGDFQVSPGVPRISWLVKALAPWGVSDSACVEAVFLLYVVSLAGLLLGWHTRVAAWFAWFTHLALNTTGTAGTYGVDMFANIALFYCIWMPVGHYASLDVLAKRVRGTPTATARLALRVLQIHLCVIYFASGLEKATGGQWWNGEAIWRAVTEPEFRQFDFFWLASVPWVAKLASWGTLLVEIGYAFLVWPRRTRKLWAVSTIGMHLGIALFMGLLSFAGLMIVLTGAAFLASPEPRAQESAADTLAPAPGGAAA
jgi:hypothetical protein